MIRVNFIGIVGLLVGLLAGIGSFADAGAVRITSAGQLIPGVSAQGQVDDYLLSNPYVRVVIDDIPHPHGFSETGGTIIDAATATGEDRFASMFTMFDNLFGRQALYSSLAIINAGGGSNTAQIRATGMDSTDPNIAVVTDYYLGPNDHFVRIVTTLTNNGTLPIAMLQVGDAVQWGLTTHFAPAWLNTNRNILGDGYDIGGKTISGLPWVASDGQGGSYGVAAAAGSSIEMSNGSSWSDTNVLYLNLAAGGGSGSYTRYFIVGSGSIASVSDIAFGIRGTTTGTLQGTVTENVTGNPIADATVIINTAACLGATSSKSYTVARTDASGAYSAKLEAGTYQVLFKATGRTTSTCQAATITANNTTTKNQTMSRQGTLSWTVKDASNNPIPAKISVLYSPLTTKLEGPTLGDTKSLTGGYAVLSSSGSGSTAIPPGTYQVWVTRGIEYEPVVQTVSVAEAGTQNINAVLNHVVTPTGYVSGDMHVHGFNSADCGVLWETRAVQAACEGLAIVVTTDHDYISDMTSAIASTGTGAYVNTFSGEEITTNEWGHFQGYPLTLHPELSKNGALAWQGLAPSDIFSWEHSDAKNPVVQINHPRAGGIGYFDLVSLNPITACSTNPLYSANYDAVEVVNGKRLYQVPQVLNDWYRLLSSGKKVTGVGNTDTHQIFSQEIGYPRNYVYVGTSDPNAVTEAAFRDAIKGGHCSITNGPFVESSVNGHTMGNLFSDTTGSVNVHVVIQAPAWMTVDTLNIIVNGQVAQTVPISPVTGVVQRLDQTFPISLSRDSWIAVEVKGGQCDTDSSSNCITPGCPGRMDPLQPPMYGTDPVCPYAHTNPVFVDFDNNGVFDAPGNQGLLVEPISTTRTIDGNYDYTRDNQVVTVRGTVTAGSYVFDHRSTTVFFQDDSLDAVNHRSAGTTIYQYSLMNPVVDPGDQIQVTGTVSNYDGLLELESVSISLLRKSGPVPDPLVLTLSQLSGSGGEQYEGMLARINNVTGMTGTWPTSGNNANMTLTDATGSLVMRIDSNTDCDGTAAPTPPFDVVGVVGQYKFASPYNSGYQIQPRQRADIIESGNPLSILHDPAADAVTSCSAIIRWYTNKAGSSSVDYGTTPSYGSTAAGSSGVTAHAVTLSGLTPNTTYHFRATSDAVTSLDATFTTAVGATPALLSGPTVNFVTNTTVQVMWQTDVASSSQVNYGTSVAYGSSSTGPSGVTNHYATLSGLLPGTTYHYQVASTSPACGSGTYSAPDATFNTPVSASAPPEISARGSLVPLTLAKSGEGITARFEYRGPGYNYHLYGAPDQAAMDAGTYSVKACDLKNNAMGTWSTDGATWASWTLTDASQLPAGKYFAVAEVAGVEGNYGYKSSGAFIAHDTDKAAPTALGCGASCAPITAAIADVTPDTTVIVGTQQSFSGTGSGQGALTYAWDFHYDGSFNSEATGASVNYTYPSVGSYVTALRLTDSCASPGPQSAIATVPITIQPSSSCGPLVVISRVYGGGGNSGAYYHNDFIELFNRGDAAQSLTGWAVQYASYNGSSWQVTTLSGSIPAGGYYLVQEAAGSTGVSLPTPDATGTIAMSATHMKVALTNSTTALSVACPTGGSLVDFVGIGSDASCSETSPAPVLTNTTADKRAGEGCTDANNNSTDFTAITEDSSNPPRNSATTPHFCTCP